MIAELSWFDGVQDWQPHSKALRSVHSDTMIDQILDRRRAAAKGRHTYSAVTERSAHFGAEQIVCLLEVGPPFYLFQM